MKRIHGPAFLAAVFVVSALLASSSGCSRGGSSASKSGQTKSTGGTAKAEAFCKHEVAERFCPFCHPEIKNDPNVLLCKEHGDIPEDICTACHPELKAKYKTCSHELPPAFCEQCKNLPGANADIDRVERHPKGDEK